MTKIAPLDRARGCSPEDFALSVVAGQVEARKSPLDFARDFKLEAFILSAARITDEQMIAGKGTATWLGLDHDLDAMDKLAESTGARLRALAYYALYRHTQDEAWLPEAMREIRAAKENWAAYAAKVKEIFVKIDDPLRMGAEFDPEKVLKHFEQIEKGIAAAQKKAKKQGRDANRQPILWNRVGAALGPVFVEPECSMDRVKKHLDVRLDFDLGKLPPNETIQPVLPARVVALVKPLNSEAQWKEQKMKREGEGGGQTASFSIALDEPPNGLLVQFILYDKQGAGSFWPDAEKAMPYLWTSDLPAVKP